MKVIVVDGQGGGVGRLMVSKLRALRPDWTILAIGTNALATSAMLRAGANAGATGDNAIQYNCQDADLLLGPSGIAVPNAMLGEISPQIAQAVTESSARKHLLQMSKCTPEEGKRRPYSLEDAVTALVREAVEGIEGAQQA